MGKTFKKEYHQRTNEYKSNRFSGWEHFRTRPFGLKHWDYGYQSMRDKLGNLRPGGAHEDCLSTINKTSYRMELKKELKHEIDLLGTEDDT